jgi:hypothetical protein
MPRRGTRPGRCGWARSWAPARTPPVPPTACSPGAAPAPPRHGGPRLSGMCAQACAPAWLQVAYKVCCECGCGGGAQARAGQAVPHLGFAGRDGKLLRWVVRVVRPPHPHGAVRVQPPLHHVLDQRVLRDLHALLQAARQALATQGGLRLPLHLGHELVPRSLEGLLAVAGVLLSQRPPQQPLAAAAGGVHFSTGAAYVYRVA